MDNYTRVAPTTTTGLRGDYNNYVNQLFFFWFAFILSIYIKQHPPTINLIQSIRRVIHPLPFLLPIPTKMVFLLVHYQWPFQTLLLILCLWFYSLLSCAVFRHHQQKTIQHVPFASFHRFATNITNLNLTLQRQPDNDKEHNNHSKQRQKSVVFTQDNVLYISATTRTSFNGGVK